MRSYRSFPCFVLNVIVLILLSLAAMKADEQQDWRRYQPIDGVGDITMTSPTGANSRNLHYGGTGRPETANFQLDVSKATDMDCNHVTGEVADAGLHEPDTDWSVIAPDPAKVGSVIDGKFTTTFTPGNTVKSGIGIKVVVRDGQKYSRANDRPDAPVEKVWQDTLTTFIVGIRMQPHLTTLYEDKTVKSPNGGSNWDNGTLKIPLGAGNLQSRVQSSIPAAPSRKTGRAGSYRRDVKWTLLAETDTGAVTGIQGAIQFDPRIDVAGAYRLTGGQSGAQPPGSTASSIAATLGGASNPYAAAAVTIGLAAMGSGAHPETIIAGESVIELGGNKVKDQIVKGRLNPPVVIKLDRFSIHRPNMQGVGGDVFNGSTQVSSQASVTDTSHLAGAWATIDKGGFLGKLPNISSSYGTRPPLYVSAGP